jgi:threonine synthase
VKYVSTRGAAPVLPFDDALLAGLAVDGGLYVPEAWPRLDGDAFRALAGRPYVEVATEVVWPFVEGAVDREVLAGLLAEAYATFDVPEVCPLTDLGDGTWLLELFHGPTLAFKDVALQVVGRLFDHVLGERGERRTILVATSGDTGSAAIEACRGRASLDIVVLFPAGRISEVQRRQMTTVPDANVHCLAVDGTFDDCQALVKGLFADPAVRERVGLSAMNSINWGRVVPQAAYYVSAALAVGAPDRTPCFAVPSGNFGNVLAGDVARRLGLPMERLVVGTNRNDTLTRFLTTGVLERREVHATSSPAMDVSVPSNLERLLFDLLGRDASALTDLMARFAADGRVEVAPGVLAAARAGFDAAMVDEDEVAATMAATYERTGVVIDPHTAVGLAAANRRRPSPGTPVVALATADPAKFPDAVEAATGVRPALPSRLADLLDRPERVTAVRGDPDEVRATVERLGRE